METKNSVINIDGLDDKCCGCGACSAICPVKSISMRYDKDGFIYPDIDNTCISCGKCVRACPINDDLHSSMHENLHWCYSKDESIRAQSSSGGFFTEIANHVIDIGGVVCGAATNEDLSVSHRLVENACELKPLLRSKYVQSEGWDCFEKIKDLLMDDREVLFVGTPCQVSGLKKYLGDNHKGTLYTIDFVCHGVPSSKLYYDMISYYEKKKNKKAVNVTFREKDEGWRRQVLKVYFDDGSVVSNKSIDTFFYYSFLKSLSLRKSCYQCKYPCHHNSDITMADFWAYKGVDDKGVSLISLNTQAGHLLYNAVVENMVGGTTLLKETPASFMEHIIIPEYNMEKRAEFFDAYSNLGYNLSQRKMKRIIRKRKHTERMKRLRLVISKIKNRFKKAKENK